MTSVFRDGDAALPVILCAMELLYVLRSGVAVGLAVALPFGPIGLTVMALGRRDWRSGVAAATGVAAADVTWALMAVAGGAVLALHPAVGLWRSLARAALVVIGVVLVVRGTRQIGRRAAAVARPIPAAHSPARYFVALYGLTLPNPLTVAVFTAAAISVGVSDAAGGPVHRTVFVGAVGLTSLVWQLTLAAMGRHLLARAGPTASAVLTMAGGALLVVWPLVS
jgi:threonine/homoserine/homoserine lactone efflux protein